VEYLDKTISFFIISVENREFAQDSYLKLIIYFYHYFNDKNKNIIKNIINN